MTIFTTKRPPGQTPFWLRNGFIDREAVDFAEAEQLRLMRELGALQALSAQPPVLNNPRSKSWHFLAPTTQLNSSDGRLISPPK